MTEAIDLLILSLLGWPYSKRWTDEEHRKTIETNICQSAMSIYLCLHSIDRKNWICGTHVGHRIITNMADKVMFLYTERPLSKKYDDNMWKF